MPNTSDMENIKICDISPAQLSLFERLPNTQVTPTVFKRCGITVNIPTTMSSTTTIIADRLTSNQTKVQNSANKNSPMN